MQAFERRTPQTQPQGEKSNFHNEKDGGREKSV